MNDKIMLMKVICWTLIILTCIMAIVLYELVLVSLKLDIAHSNIGIIAEQLQIDEIEVELMYLD